MAGIFRNPDVMWREEADALADVKAGLDRGDDVEEIGTAVLFFGGKMLSVNFLGAEIWKLCDGRSMEDILSELLEQFEVEENELRSDVQGFIEDLTQKGFITHEE